QAERAVTQFFAGFRHDTRRQSFWSPTEGDHLDVSQNCGISAREDLVVPTFLFTEGSGPFELLSHCRFVEEMRWLDVYESCALIVMSQRGMRDMGSLRIV